MKFERSLKQYFKPTEKGGYYLRRTHELPNGRTIEAVDESMSWTPKEAKGLVRIFRENNVASAPEELLKRKVGIETE